MRVTVVGLGPGPTDLLTLAAQRLLAQTDVPVVARTRFHPALDGRTLPSLDALYEQATTLAEVSEALVAHLLGFEDVVLAVPGDGTLGEGVLDGLRAAGASVVVVPGVPLAVGALAASGLSASDGVQALEATSEIELNPRWPAVVTGVFNRQVASDLKLALGRVYPPEQRLAIVHHPLLPDERVLSVALADLDRSAISFDHLTHVVLPSVATEIPTGSAHGLRAIVARLRAPEIGCPWDLEQTHRTLTPYVIEEAYEVVDAIEDDDPAGLAEELGDVLLQVALHAEVADQSGEFDWNDVVRGLSAKLVRRHPHVFGEVQVSGASDVVRNWDVLKAAEKSSVARTSAVDGVPRSLPALKQATEIGRKAVKVGFDWPSRAGTVDKVREELAELLAAETLDERREELGDLLWIIAKLAWQDGVDPEEALRAANKKFVARFQLMEALAAARGAASLAELPREALMGLWQEAKARLKSAV